MTEQQKIEIVSAMAGEANEVTVSAYLSLAASKILRKAYPFDTEVSEVPKQYESIQIEITVYLLNKRGAEGQTAHIENGVSATYGSADVPAAMLRGVIPLVGVLQ